MLKYKNKAYKNLINIFKEIEIKLLELTLIEDIHLT